MANADAFHRVMLAEAKAATLEESAQGVATSSSCGVESRQLIHHAVAFAKRNFSAHSSLTSVLLPPMEILRTVDAPDVGSKLVNRLFAAKAVSSGPSVAQDDLPYYSSSSTLSNTMPPPA